MFVAWSVCVILATISGYDNIVLTKVIVEILEHGNIIMPDLQNTF